MAVYHTAQLCERYGKGLKGFSPEFVEALATYDWPGNVRELVNALERALTAAGDEPMLFPDHLSLHIRAQVARASVGKGTGTDESMEPAKPFPKLYDLRETAMAELEKEYLLNLMKLAGSNVKEACRLSGISRPRLYALMKRHGITRKE